MSETKIEFKEIDLKQIVTSKTNPRKDFDEVAIIELSESIKGKGVLQPILVRPSGKDKYELVCGERRLRASRIAKMETIPSTIRELTDEEAFDLQITENLQRKDIHPLDEAVAFYALINGKSQDPKEVALRFGKSETYIAQRLKLNDLIEPFKKDFYENKMLLGHAILLARLTPAYQNECRSEYQVKSGSEYRSVKSVAEHIERNIMHSLSSVPFKKEDVSLVPAAGACINCPKRTGANLALFPDIKRGDNCLDAKCFTLKIKTSLFNKVKDALENNPDLLLAADYSAIDNDIKALADKYKVKILKQYNDYETARGKDKGVKAIMVSGSDTGKIVTIKLKKEASDKNSNSNDTASVKVQIAAIEQRQERADELDAEKVYDRILKETSIIEDNSFNDKKHFKKFKSTPKLEKILYAFMFWDLIDGADDDMLCELLGIDIDEPEAFEKAYTKLTTLTATEKAFILTHHYLYNYNDNHPTNFYAFIKTKLAEELGVPVKQFLLEQEEIATKRKERAAVRIKALKDDAKKPAAKNSPKKTSKAKAEPVGVTELDEDNNLMDEDDDN